MNVEDFKIKSIRIDDSDEWPGCAAWKVTVTNPRGRTYTEKFYKGSAHGNAEPDLMEFMYSLVSNASLVAERGSVEEFAADLGYQIETAVDRRKVEKLYNACVRVAKRLETYLTDEEREFFADY